MQEIAGLIAAANSAYTLLSTAISARDDAKVRSAQAEVQQKLGDALSMSISQLQTTHALELEAQKLRTELVEVQRRNQELAHELEQRRAYKLAQPAPGKWAYLRVEDEAGPPETTAYFCATCKAKGQEVPLQHKPATPGFDALLKCSVDKAHHLDLGGALPIPIQRSSPQAHNPFARRF